MTRTITDTRWHGDVPADLAVQDYRDGPDFEALYDAWRAGGHQWDDYPSPARNAPYQPGDVMFANLGSCTHPPSAVRVIDVYIERLETRGYSIPRYRVQWITKAGRWSRQWIYIFPGHVTRAYFDDAGDERNPSINPDLTVSIDTARVPS